MNLFLDEKFKRAVQIVRKFTTGYCLDQSRASSKNIWEMWLVGKTQVLITAKRDEAREETFIEIWSPVTESMRWDDTERAVSEIQAKA